MFNRFTTMLLAALVIAPLVIAGCKSKTEKITEVGMTEMQATDYPGVEPSTATDNTMMAAKEPAQTIASETIPPTATPPQVLEKQPTVSLEKDSRNKEIQIALKAAGFYTGAIDGKIGPKSKKAIEEFQSAKGLKVDGKVGPKTWAELEKYLVQQ